MRRLSERLPLRVHEPAPLVPSQLPAGPGERAGARQRSLHPDLGRFSRYWRWAEPRLWGGVPGTLEASGPASPGRLEPAGDGSTR